LRPQVLEEDEFEEFHPTTELVQEWEDEAYAHRLVIAEHAFMIAHHQDFF
jgi:hypothetical protein